MREHESALVLLVAAAAIALLMAAFAPRAVPAATHAPARDGGPPGLAIVDGKALVDVNSADEALLMELPGVGASLARAIEAGRPYASVEDLLAVRGIGPAKLERMRDRIVALPAATRRSRR